MIVQPKYSKILVIGDYCIDKYITVTPSPRKNPEDDRALLLEEYNETTNFGMAANVARCAARLGFDVDLITPQDNDPIIKSRYIDKTSGKQLFRIDRDKIYEPCNLNCINWNVYSAVILSDYNKGFLTYDTIIKILDLSTSQVFMDTKKPKLSKFKNLNCIIKINEHEAKLADYIAATTIITLGNKGAMLNNVIYQQYVVNSIDTCGAGDAFMAGLVYGALEGWRSGPITYANVNAALSTLHVGTYGPTEDELISGVAKYLEQEYDTTIPSTLEKIHNTIPGTLAESA